MLNLMDDRDAVSVVDDQRGSPTNAADLAGLVCRIIKSDSKEYGIYHYSNEGDITWYDFACEIYALGRENGMISSACSVNPCKSEDFPTKAKRPEYSLLSKDKVKRVFGVGCSGVEGFA